MTHRRQQKVGTFCGFPRDTPISGSHPASQVPQSTERQGHCPREEGCVCRTGQITDMDRSPAPHQWASPPLWLSIASSVKWEQGCRPRGPQEEVKSPGSQLWTLHSLRLTPFPGHGPPTQPHANHQPSASQRTVFPRPLSPHPKNTLQGAYPHPILHLKPLRLGEAEKPIQPPLSSAPSTSVTGHRTV